MLYVEQMNFKMEETSISVENEISSLGTADLMAVIKLETEIESEDGTNCAGNIVDYFEISKDLEPIIKIEDVDINSTDVPSSSELLSFSTNNCPSLVNPNNPEPAVYMKVENNDLVEGSDRKRVKTEKDWSSEIKIRRIEAIPTDVPVSLEGVPSYVDCGPITKEEDLGVVEEETEEAVGSHFMLFSENQEYFKCDVDSPQAGTSYVETNKRSSSSSLGKGADCDYFYSQAEDGSSEVEEVPVTCGVKCEYSPPPTQNLKVHPVAPAAKKPLLCMYCSAGFSKKKLLLKHLRTHSDHDKILCTYCPSLIMVSNFSSHLVSHINETPLLCSFCPARFRSEDLLEKHQIFHKRLKCGVCRRSFRKNSDLVEHYACHSEERPFLCIYCPAMFTTKSSLYHHQKIHTLALAAQALGR